MSTSTSSRPVFSISDRVAWRGRTGCLRDELESFARPRLKKTDRVALEATTNTWSVVAILRPFVAKVVVGNPLKTRAIPEAKSGPTRWMSITEDVEEAAVDHVVEPLRLVLQREEVFD